MKKALIRTAERVSELRVCRCGSQEPVTVNTKHLHLSNLTSGQCCLCLRGEEVYLLKVLCTGRSPFAQRGREVPKMLCWTRPTWVQACWYTGLLNKVQQLTGLASMLATASSWSGVLATASSWSGVLATASIAGHGLSRGTLQARTSSAGHYGWNQVGIPITLLMMAMIKMMIAFI